MNNNNLNDYAIQIKNLKKSYKNVQALKGINLTVNKGELFSYLGPNGAGKTTTIRILTGLTRSSKSSNGQCKINGFDISKHVIEAKQQYGLVPQSINLDQELTVADNLMIHGRLFRMKTSLIKKQADWLLNYVELEDKKKTDVKNLSGGMKRRLMIARALLHSPGVLFLDEPTAGLDPGIRRRIWALIKRIQSQGTTVFLTTHYIEEAEFLADRVAFLDKGQIVALDTPENFMNNIGAFAIDRLKDGKMETIYFKDRKQAQDFNTSSLKHYTLRRVNLEDAFLKLTGKKELIK